MGRSLKSSKLPTMNVVGLFPDDNSTMSALVGVERRGIARTDVSVTSSVPFPEGTLRTDVAQSRLPFISAFGAFCGFLLGIALAAGTAAVYPLRTGGKPIVALPTVGVITYEMTMLGIILLTLIGVLYEMRLPSSRKPWYDPRISDGYIGVVVPVESPAQAAEIEEVLRESGAIDIKRFDEV